MGSLRIAAVALGLSVGCGISLPSPEDLAVGKNKAQASMEAVDHLRVALGVLQLMPSYDCGQPRRTFVGKAVQSVEADLDCVQVASEPGVDSDTLHLSFAPTGCRIADQSITGEADILYSGGEDRLSVDGNLEDVRVDGEPLQSHIGYDACGDSSRYWVKSHGIGRKGGLPFTVEADATLKDGDTLTLDGKGEIDGESGADGILVQGLQIELGEYLPKEGRLEITTASGHVISVTFRERLWILGEADLSVDGSLAVPIPIVR